MPCRPARPLRRQGLVQCRAVLRAGLQADPTRRPRLHEFREDLRRMETVVLAGELEGVSGNLLQHASTGRQGLRHPRVP